MFFVFFYKFEQHKHRAMTAQWVACSFIQVEKCVRSDRCKKGSCWCLSEAESCQSCTEQPTWQNTCLKLMPIDHHEQGKIAGHAGIASLWEKQTITVHQHIKQLRLLTQLSCCDTDAVFASLYCSYHVWNGELKRCVLQGRSIYEVKLVLKVWNYIEYCHSILSVGYYQISTIY